MELIEIVEDITRARQELAALTDLDPARLELCHRVINGLEDTLEEIILKPWIPITSVEIEGAIHRTMQRVEEVEQLIVDAAPMLERKQPDEIFRFSVALIALATLNFQLQVLLEAQMHLLGADAPAFVN